MTVSEFVGYTAIAFVPPFALYYFAIAPDAIILTASACFWLFLALFLSSMWRTSKEASVKDVKKEEEIISAWKPKPLVDEPEEDDLEDSTHWDSSIWGPIENRPGKHIEIQGQKYLNLATHNYLGLVEEPELDKEAERCIRKYGVGSCGPRGFYGTVDVHLELEEKIAEFLNLEETALYSFGFSTIASAIPSYSKVGDIIFADEQVNFSIQKGLQASRSVIHYFKHNDYKDLERLLDEQVVLDRKNPKKAKITRRFCVVEGIYSKTGEMCPLKDVAILCRKHKVRLFVDESISFCTIGETGRGVTEHLNVPIEDVDLISGSLEHGLAAFGGFIVGPSFVVDHQRISGLGYCFSASLPPLLAGVGIKALKLVEENPKMIQELQTNCKYMHTILKKLKHFEVGGHELSPIKHIFLKNIPSSDRRKLKEILNKIIIHVKDSHKIAMIQPAYLEKKEVLLPPPSIRLTVSRVLTNDEMNAVVYAIEDACKSIIR